jgi:hypothetical protein
MFVDIYFSVLNSVVVVVVVVAAAAGYIVLNACSFPLP